MARPLFMSFFCYERGIYMPKTRKQSLFFTALMVFCMVYCMTTYTIALKSGAMSQQVLLLAFQEMWLEYIVVFCAIFFVISPNAQKLTFKTMDPTKAKPLSIILTIQCFTVCQIVPVITLFATVVHNGISINWFNQWIQLILMCFPFALFMQIFIIGPFVRCIFRRVVKN